MRALRLPTRGSSTGSLDQPLTTCVRSISKSAQGEQKFVDAIRMPACAGSNGGRRTDVSIAGGVTTCVPSTAFS